MSKILIIGGGVSGLSAGIYAQLQGYEAIICERHNIAGGNLTGWDRGGYHIDNCVHWLTGTASTVMVASVEGILGLKPESYGIVIEPCIPSDWKEFTIKKLFRGKWLNITVINPNGNEWGVKCITVNGKEIDGTLITEDILCETNDIKVEM